MPAPEVWFRRTGKKRGRQTIHDYSLGKPSCVALTEEQMWEPRGFSHGDSAKGAWPIHRGVNGLDISLLPRLQRTRRVHPRHHFCHDVRAEENRDRTVPVRGSRFMRDTSPTSAESDPRGLSWCDLPLRGQGASPNGLGRMFSDLGGRRIRPPRRLHWLLLLPPRAVGLTTMADVDDLDHPVLLVLPQPCPPDALAKA